MNKKKKKPKTASLKYENSFLRCGCTNIIGMDEAGYGALAGPVAVGAVCLPLVGGTRNLKVKQMLAGVRDSKDMTPLQRSELAEKIKEHATAYGIGSASALEIDTMGMANALREAMKRALESLAHNAPDGFHSDCVFLEEVPWPEMSHQYRLVHIVDGDTRSLSIAAASVLAKTWRDEQMVILSEQFPDYQFAVHKGYGTLVHRNALRQYGACDLHRKTYKPVQKVVQGS